ncbi:hypothetical protein BES08_11960 [Novosphingobium resinovorum]|uniref:Uncharacterized protein n=1 Tax=Novosphingobium resinovorum TaxID=158500 RepID=A0A1D8A989_9SPHN|nr:hypothetical protein BES08_11960 [Novosphingobium resinovorum]
MVLGGCASFSTKEAAIPAGSAAYEAIRLADVPPPDQYLLAPADELQMRVFGEPELSFEKIRVDQLGNLQVPLIGQIKVADRTVPDVTAEIKNKLGNRFLKDPKVNLSVVEQAPRYVTVEGQVEQPGIFEMNRDLTLLSAIAMARSTTDVAKIDQVIVLRTVNGQQMAARFDLRDIRGGAAPNPLLRDGDIVTVGYSSAAGFWQGVLKAAPFVNAFVLASR